MRQVHQRVSAWLHIAYALWGVEKQNPEGIAAGCNDINRLTRTNDPVHVITLAGVPDALVKFSMFMSRHPGT